MPFTDQATRTEIQEWIKEDGPGVGRVTTETPLALGKDLLEVVWAGIQAMEMKLLIFYVCNTTLEAELLDHALKDRSFHAGKIGEQSGVDSTGDIALLSYAQLRSMLDRQVRRPGTSLPCRLVVICEQEPGSNMDAVIARGHLALLFKNYLLSQPGCNVKLLGLSYRLDGGGNWLRHAACVMTTTISLDHTVRDPAGASQPMGRRRGKDEADMEETAREAADFLKQQRDVVVYGSTDDTKEFGKLVGLALGKVPEYFDQFSTGIPRDVKLDLAATPLFSPPVIGMPPSLVLVEPAAFPTALPFSHVGMTVSIVKSLQRRVYDEKLHLVTSSPLSQSDRSVESQRWTGQVRDAQRHVETEHSVEIIGLDLRDRLPREDAHIQAGTHDPLRGCFDMVAAYPGTAFNLLPVFGAVDEPLDLAVRLRFMGLVESQTRGYSQRGVFVLTSRGKRADLMMEIEATLTLEAAAALAAIDMSPMSTKLARSLLRLSFMKEMSGSFVRACPMGLEDNDAFASFMRGVPQDAVQGGPGRHSVSRGLLWLIWTAFEMFSFETGVMGSELGPSVMPGDNWPFFVLTEELKEAMSQLAAWECLVGLGPIEDAERDDWNRPLGAAEMEFVEREIARANYSALLTIPRKRVGQREDFHAVWLRTNERAEIQGEFDRYLHATRREGILSGAVPLSVSTHEDGRASVDGLMLLDYSVSQELIGDLEAEGVDPWVRAVAMQDR